MSRLTKLDLAGCNLVQLPWNIEQLQELKVGAKAAQDVCTY